MWLSVVGRGTRASESGKPSLHKAKTLALTHKGKEAWLGLLKEQEEEEGWRWEGTTSSVPTRFSC